MAKTLEEFFIQQIENKEIEIDISKFLYEVTYFNIIYYQCKNNEFI